MQARLLLCAWALLSAPSALSAVGLLVYPMQQEIEAGESTTYIASNQSERAIAVEVIPETWTIDEEGNEIREPTDEVVAYPSQFILKGNTYKKVKVGLREAGSSSDRERTYRVTIRELPISLEPEEPGSYRIYHASGYRTSLYIRPDRAKPDLKLVGAARAGSKLTLRFQNEGQAHVHLRNPSLAFVDKEGNELAKLGTAALKPVQGQNMHAGSVRKFEVDLSNHDVPRGATAVRMLFEDNGLLQSSVLETGVDTE